MSEAAEGDWTFDGKTVRLTSKPMPKLPSFELVRDDPAPKGEIVMTMEADTAHKFWLGNLNVPLALAKRKVKVDGNLTKMMGLLPAIGPAYARYAEYLKANGRADLAG